MAHRFSYLALLISLLFAVPCAGQAIVSGSSSVGANIPDNPVSGVGTVESFSITDSRIIQSARFRIDDLVHGWVGDLVATVSHTGVNEFGVVDTVSARLFERTGRAQSSGPGDSTDVNGTYFFRDDATTINTNPANNGDWTAESANNNEGIIAPGIYRASNSLGAFINLDNIFAGRQAGGEYTLRITDEFTTTVGSYSGFGADLVVSSVPEPASGIMLIATSMYFLRRRRS